jgi:aspartyl-tRNA(Asn)/glutamyl-tRNA(Gln) amidotransferase subunit A
VPDWPNLMPGNVKGLRIGIPKEYRVNDIPEIEKLWQNGIEWLKRGGAEIVDISLPHTKYALPTYYIIAPAECSSNLARYDGVRYGVRKEGENLRDMYEITRAEGFGPEVTRRIMVGTYVLSAGYYDAYYVKAQKVRRLILNDFLEAWKKCDAILTPATTGGAFAIGENEDDPIKMYLQDVFTVALNLAGLPGMSVPAGLDAQGLPLGLQIIGKAFDEQTVFNVSRAIEAAANFSAMPQLVQRKAAA